MSHLAVTPPRRRGLWLIAGIVALVLVAGGTTAAVTLRGHATPRLAHPAQVTLSGTAQVGETVTVAAGRWPPGTRLTYQWYADGSALPGATAPALTVPATAAGHALSVRVHGAAAGHVAAALSSRPASVAAGILRAPKKPTLTGRPIVGKTVRAKVPSAWPHDLRLSYHWLAGGKPVAGATRPRYTLPRTLVGDDLSVRVTGSRTGYQRVVKTSSATTVMPDNPLVGGRWAVYQGPWNGIYPAYEHASGENKTVLGRIARRPRMIWFAANLSTSRVGSDVRDFITEQQHGDPNALVQMAIFRQWPREEAGRGTPLSGAEQADYRAWIDQVASAIGDARVAMVLEPDLGLDAVPNNPGDKRTADPATRLGLVRYAAQRFGKLKHTTVYLDASDADWLSTAKEVPLLEAAGIAYVRGIALGATHYSSVGDNISYGADLVDALAQAGYPDKHIVIDTADNGRPFTWAQYYAKHPHGDFDNAEPCGSTSETLCDTLGIPPTTDVTGHPELGLDATQEKQAARYVDAYLWFGRPWLVRQASPFSLTRSLQVARTTPFP